MIKITEDIERRLKRLSMKTDDLYSNSDYIKSLGKIIRSKNPRFNEYNLIRIKSQIPAGIYRNITELINTLNNQKDNVFGSITTFSPIAINAKELDVCKKLPYKDGNIITGRDNEINEILLTLAKKDKRGVILVGEPGTGKTAIVRAINIAFVNNTVPMALKGCKLYNMDIPYIFTHYKEDPMTRIINVLEKASADPKHILFIDEVHQMLGAKLNDILKPYLTEKIRFIGSTTIDEYHAIINDDRALERRFTIVNVKEPNIKETSEMIINTKMVYEEYHHCSIPNDICEYLVENGTRYLGHRKNPDKSLTLLDQACTIMNDASVIEVTPNIQEKETLNTDYELSNLEVDKFRIEKTSIVAGDRTLTKHFVDKAISAATGMDYGRIRNSLDYGFVVNTIKSSVFGQDAAVEELANVSNIIKHINYDSGQPISTLLLVGDRGVGKTVAATQLAELIFGNASSIITYDLGAFKDAFQLTELKGAPPGYVGYSKSGKLIKDIKNRPQSLIYFKNVTECHPDILSYILSSVKSGKMTDSADREVKLNNSIIIFSATLTKDQSSAINKGSMGFSKKSDNEKQIIEKLEKYINKDLIASVSSVINFNQLTDDVLVKIYEANVNKYTSMYNVKVDRNKLYEKVFADGCKNGHDVINKLSSIVPKMMFNISKEGKRHE